MNNAYTLFRWLSCFGVAGWIGIAIRCAVNGQNVMFCLSIVIVALMLVNLSEMTRLQVTEHDLYITGDRRFKSCCDRCGCRTYRDNFGTKCPVTGCDGVLVPFQIERL